MNRLVVKMILFFADSCDQLGAYVSFCQGLWADFYFYGYHVNGYGINTIDLTGGREKSQAKHENSQGLGQIYHAGDGVGNHQPVGASGGRVSFCE